MNLECAQAARAEKCECCACCKGCVGCGSDIAYCLLPCCLLQFGTLSHMPPCLLREGRLTTRADVYAFAMVMWQLFTVS
jgi:hypothetical protein